MTTWFSFTSQKSVLFVPVGVAGAETAQSGPEAVELTDDVC